MNMKRDIKRLKDEAALARHIVSELATAVMKLSEMVMEIANSAVPIEPEKKADRFVTGTTAAADLKKELEEAARVMDGLLKDKPNYAPGDRVRIKRPVLEGIEGVVVTVGPHHARVEMMDDRGGCAICSWDEMEPVDKEKTGKVFVTGTTIGRLKSDEPKGSAEELKSDTVSKSFKAGDRVRLTGGRFKGVVLAVAFGLGGGAIGYRESGGGRG